jgi:hypothetical protein
MKETRVKKFNTYRKQIEKQFDEPVNTNKEPSTKVIYPSSVTNTTGTLPLDEIVDTERRMSEEELALKKQDFNNKLKLALLIGGIIIVAALIIVIGICLF